MSLSCICIRDGVLSSLQDVVLGSLKPFFQLDHQVDVTVDNFYENQLHSTTDSVDFAWYWLILLAFKVSTVNIWEGVGFRTMCHFNFENPFFISKRCQRVWFLLLFSILISFFLTTQEKCLHQFSGSKYGPWPLNGWIKDHSLWPLISWRPLHFATLGN